MAASADRIAAGGASVTALKAGTFAQLPAHVHKRFFSKFAPEVVQRMGVHGDGTCFFHSLAAAINYNNYMQLPLAKRQAQGQEFRCDFESKVGPDAWEELATTSPHNIRAGFKEVRDNFCRPRVWAEETMIKLTSMVMGLNVVFIDSRANNFYCGVSGDPETQDTVVMMWVDHSHFEPIMFMRKRCADHVHMDGLLHCTRDKAAVKKVMQTFGALCPTPPTGPSAVPKVPLLPLLEKM